MTASAPGPIDGHIMQAPRLHSGHVARNSHKPPLKPVPHSGSTPAGTVHRPGESGLVEATPSAVEPAALQARSYHHFTPAKLEAFVVVAEEGGFSAAGRRLHISQPALSQTINALERQVGVDLFVRSSTGVQTTQAGRALVDEARAILARHDQLIGAIAAYASEGGGVIRLAIPLELAPDVLRALAKFTTDHPQTRVEPRHLSMADQLAALRSGQLEVSFMREKPPGPEFDTMLLVTRENLGVLLSEEQAARLAGPEGIGLDALAGLDWVGFPRSNSPAWYDELAAILRTHGIDAGTADGGDQFPIPSVMFTAVTSGRAFALAPPLWAHPIPHTVVWTPLAGDPVVRRTWAVWPAGSRRRDVAQLITAFEQLDIGQKVRSYESRMADFDGNDEMAKHSGHAVPCFPTISEVWLRLFEAYRDAGQRRRHTVSLTAAGKTRLKEVEHPLTAVEQRVLDPLTPQEQQMLYTLLVRATANPTCDEVLDTARACTED